MQDLPGLCLIAFYQRLIHHTVISNRSSQCLGVSRCCMGLLAKQSQFIDQALVGVQQCRVPCESSQ